MTKSITGSQPNKADPEDKTEGRKARDQTENEVVSLAKHLQEGNSEFRDVCRLQSLTAKVFPPSIKNYGYIYSYATLSEYFWAPENRGTLLKMAVIPKWHLFVKPLKSNLKLYTLITSWLFYVKSIEVLVMIVQIVLDCPDLILYIIIKTVIRNRLSLINHNICSQMFLHLICLKWAKIHLLGPVSGDSGWSWLGGIRHQNI